MIRPDQGKYPITQYFGENPDIYVRFGLSGHNGWDIGCPTGTILVASHDGKITEIANDIDGYGIYLKIENNIEGSLLAHNKKTLVNLGQSVVQGQAVCVSDNTGFSTGSHSHWGYFRKPRDRTNGYNGYVDQRPYLDGDVIIPPSGDIVFTDQTKIPIGGNYGEVELQQLRSMLIAKDNRIKELEGSTSSPEAPNSSDNPSSGQMIVNLIKEFLMWIARFGKK